MSRWWQVWQGARPETWRALEWEDLAIAWREFGAAVRARAPDLEITELEIRRIWWRLTGSTGPQPIDVRATVLGWRCPGAAGPSDPRERPPTPRPERPRAHRRRPQPLRGLGRG